MWKAMVPIILLFAVGLTMAQSPVKKAAPISPIKQQQPLPPIPFAPLEEPFVEGDATPPAAPVPQQVGAVSIYFEEGTLRFLVFDSQGWLPDVKRIQLSASVVSSASHALELLSYPGAYAPSNPEIRQCQLGKIATLTAAEFQIKLDEASRGVAQSVAVRP